MEKLEKGRAIDDGAYAQPGHVVGRMWCDLKLGRDRRRK